MKYLQLVASRWNLGDAEISASVGNSIIGGCQRDDHGAHLRMDVAKNERDAGFVELDEARGSALGKPTNEAFALEQRKHVVKKRIVVRELYLSSHRNYQK